MGHRMHKYLRAAAAALVACWSVTSAAQEIPPGLREWQGWVLKGEEYRQCPFLASADLTADEPIAADSFRCAWPEKLTLSVDARGGNFAQRWQVFARSWVTLPGDTENWPRDVRLNGAAAPVVEHEGNPGLMLAPGNYTIAGRFEWSARPESLPMADSTAIVELSVDGLRVAQPERPDGAVWLGKR